MASDASTLVLDLNRLTVAKLKDVCRALGERVSGNRPELVSRLTFAFEQRAARPDRMREARAVVDAALGAKASARPGSAALPLTSSTSSTSSTSTATATATSAGNHSTSSSTAPLLRALASPLLPLKPLQKLVPQTAPRPNIASLVFRQSPFYSVKEAKPVTRSFPCDTGRAQVKFTLSQADLNSLLIGSDVLLLFVGPESGLTLKPNPFKISGIPIEYPPLDGAHSNAPNHCAIMVNGHMVPPKDYSGIRGKPYTAKPLELNQFLLKNPSTYNTIDLKFTPIMDATRNLLVVVQFASRVNVSNIVDNLKSDKLIPKDSIIAERRQKTVADDDVCLTEEHVSLKDPVTRCRITVPARGNHCRHPQCFDLEYYLRLNQTHPTWSCPICSKLAPLNDVFVDGYFLELLQAAAFDLDIESAEIAADGSWRLNKEENTGVCSDSDSDAGPPTKKIKTDPTATMKAPTAQASSEAIIDLTLSDDDEPSRTAPQIASSQQFTTPVPATPAPATSHPATPRANYLQSYSQSPLPSGRSSSHSAMPRQSSTTSLNTPSLASPARTTPGHMHNFQYAPSQNYAMPPQPDPFSLPSHHQQPQVTFASTWPQSLPPPFPLHQQQQDYALQLPSFSSYPISIQPQLQPQQNHPSTPQSTHQSTYPAPPAQLNGALPDPSLPPELHRLLFPMSTGQPTPKSPQQPQQSEESQQSVHFQQPQTSTNGSNMWLNGSTGMGMVSGNELQNRDRESPRQQTQPSVQQQQQQQQLPLPDGHNLAHFSWTGSGVLDDDDPFEL